MLIYLKTAWQQAPGAREQTSELPVRLYTVTDPFYGKATWQGQPDSVCGAENVVNNEIQYSDTAGAQSHITETDTISSAEKHTTAQSL